MDYKKIARYAATTVVTFAILSAALAYAFDGPSLSFPMPFSKAYVAQVNATGTLDLKNSTGDNSYSFDINTTFVCLVPRIIVPNEYDAEFHGFAAAREDRVRLEGLMVVDSDNFWTAFAVDKPSNISSGRYSANGSLHLNISEFAFPQPEITMVSMKGNVTKFGDKDVFGFLEANARTGIHNFTKINTRFTLQPPPRNVDEGENPQNFTASFYIVTLVNATKTEMNYNGDALFVEGYWNVYNKTLTVTYYGDEETAVVNVHTLLENSSGTFNVTLAAPTTLDSEQEAGLWKTSGNFTLDIPDLEHKITGNVIFYHAKFAYPGDRFIPRGDFNRDHIVNMMDVSRVARAFYARYGDPKYESELDSDGKLVINMIDIARVAAEFGQEY